MSRLIDQSSRFQKSDKDKDLPSFIDEVKSFVRLRNKLMNNNDSATARSLKISIPTVRKYLNR